MDGVAYMHDSKLPPPKDYPPEIVWEIHPKSMYHIGCGEGFAADGESYTNTECNGIAECGGCELPVPEDVQLVARLFMFDDVTF